MIAAVCVVVMGIGGYWLMGPIMAKTVNAGKYQGLESSAPTKHSAAPD